MSFFYCGACVLCVQARDGGCRFVMHFLRGFERDIWVWLVKRLKRYLPRMSGLPLVITSDFISVPRFCPLLPSPDIISISADQKGRIKLQIQWWRFSSRLYCPHPGTWQRGKSEQPVAFVSWLPLRPDSGLVSEQAVWGLQGSPIPLRWWLHAPLDAW